MIINIYNCNTGVSYHPEDTSYDNIVNVRNLSVLKTITGLKRNRGNLRLIDYYGSPDLSTSRSAAVQIAATQVHKFMFNGVLMGEQPTIRYYEPDVAIERFSRNLIITPGSMSYLFVRTDSKITIRKQGDPLDQGEERDITLISGRVIHLEGNEVDASKFGDTPVFNVYHEVTAGTEVILPLLY